MEKRDSLARIAAKICELRQTKKIETTGELEDICFHAYPVKKIVMEKRSSATRSFQTLRIAVNDELRVLEHTLPENYFLPYLAPGGVLAVISFHSLEDRIVKHTYKIVEKTDFSATILTKAPMTTRMKSCLRILVQCKTYKHYNEILNWEG